MISWQNNKKIKIKIKYQHLKREKRVKNQRKKDKLII